MEGSPVKVTAEKNIIAVVRRQAEVNATEAKGKTSEKKGQSSKCHKDLRRPRTAQMPLHRDSKRPAVRQQLLQRSGTETELHVLISKHENNGN